MTELDGVMRGFYDAAIGDLAWEEALDRAAVVLNARIAAMTAFDTETGALRHSIFRGLDPRHVEAYVTQYRAIDPRLAFVRAQPGRVAYDRLHSTEQEIDHDPFYDWYQRASGMRYYIGGTTRPGGRISAALSLHRTREAGHVGPDDVARFATVFEHFRRAVQIAYRLEVAAQATSPAQSLTAGSPVGIVHLDRAGAPIAFNDQARRMADAGDGFRITPAGLVALRRGDDDRLQHAIARALLGIVTDPAAPPGAAARIARSTGLPDYVVLVVPLPLRQSVFGSVSPAAVAFISDPCVAPGLPEARLRELYGLTPAELRLAARLTAGDTLEQMAQSLAVALPTLRSQLASLFRKTGTGRQADLVRLLLTAPWQFGPR